MPTQGGTTDRGYGPEHRAERERWRPDVEAGQVTCHATTCLEPDRLIRPGQAWDLGHTTDRSGWTGPEHRRCNRADGGRRRHNPAPPRRWIL